MEAQPDQFGIVDNATEGWRQGDCVVDPAFPIVHLADLSKPLSAEAVATAKEFSGDEDQGDSLEIVTSELRGVVLLSQSCDIIRGSKERHFVEVAALVEAKAPQFDMIKRGRMPAYAFIPGLESERLVAHLERTMTVEKSVLVGRTKTEGLRNDDERRTFADQLGRKKSRFAFPNDFVLQVATLRKRFLDRVSKNHAEGVHMRALREIRIKARPSWAAAVVFLTFWFVVEHDPEGHPPDWSLMVEDWMALVPFSGQYKLELASAVELKDITALDYVESDRWEYGA